MFCIRQAGRPPRSCAGRPRLASVGTPDEQGAFNDFGGLVASGLGACWMHAHTEACASEFLGVSLCFNKERHGESRCQLYRTLCATSAVLSDGDFSVKASVCCLRLSPAVAGAAEDGRGFGRGRGDLRFWRHIFGENLTSFLLPKPGRLRFVASIKHCGRPPSRLFWGQRLTLAIKFVAARE